MDFEFVNQDLEGVLLINYPKKEDNCGYFCSSYDKNVFLKNGLNFDFFSEKSIYSDFKTLRGLFFHKDNNILFRVCCGSVLFVVVDLRHDSTTFGKHIKMEISSDDCSILYIPSGFAYGYLTLSDFSYVSIVADSKSLIEFSNCIVWNDRDLNIDWGINYTPIIPSNVEYFELNKINI